MKKKTFDYPDWDNPTGRIITRADKVGHTSIWKECQPNDAETLTLCVTVEVKGSLYVPFGNFKSLAERDAARKEADRQESWRNALAFAEHLWRAAPHREYIVMFKPGNVLDRDLIYIYQKIPPLVELKKESVSCG